MNTLKREERGSAVIAAILLTAVMMAIGLATATYVDGQQTQSGGERVRESAFNVAESALGAQLFQLSQAPWPSTPGSPLPAFCTPSSSATPTCPDAASLAASYTTSDYSTAPCPGGVASAPMWKTWAHDDSDGAGGSQRFYSATLPSGALQPTWDSNANGRMWVKATGTARCKQRTLVTAVQRGTKLLNFPQNAVTANWFTVTNNGRKVIIDTQGGASQPHNVVARCKAPAPSPCMKFDPSKGQVSPNTTQVDSSAADTSLPLGDLAAFKAWAQSLGTYYPAGTCPPSLTGAAVYVEDFTGCSGGDANSAAVPGHLYIARGTLSLGGNTRIYGLVYMGNLQGSSGAVVSLSGNARITGAVAIDGLGGLSAGSSKANVVFDDRVFDDFKGIATVGQAPNSWRELQPGA